MPEMLYSTVGSFLLSSVHIAIGVLGSLFPELAEDRTVESAMLSHFSHVRLCDPIDGSPPGSPVPGILQARTLEWDAISFSNA